MIIWTNIFAVIGAISLYFLFSFLSTRLMDYLLDTKPNYQRDFFAYILGGIIVFPFLILVLILLPFIKVKKLELRILELEKKILLKNKKNAKRRKNA